MTTRTTLRTRVRRALNDPVGQYFSDADLNQWINDAIEDYSIYFPLETSTTINCIANTRSYSLSTAPHRIHQVEYPAGQDPPQYLQRRNVTDLRDSGFWGEEYYDLYGEPPHTLVIGQKPALGETIIVRYQTDHTALTTDASVLTIQDRDLDLIEMYVRWCAIVAIESSESASPTPTQGIPILSTLGTNSRGARREYNQAIQARTRAQSRIVRWGIQEDWRV